MVLAYTQEHIYRHPWRLVTSAALRKFTHHNGLLPHILDVHTLSVHHDGARLSAVRSISARSPPLPSLLRRLASAVDRMPGILCVESSVVDARRSTMEVVSRNVTLRGMIEVEEKGIYRPHEERPEEWTVYRQETRISCRPMSSSILLGGAVERRCAERFRENAGRAREVVEMICRSIRLEEV